MKNWDEYVPPEYRSTPEMIRNFLEGAIWHDIETTLEQALEMTRDGLEVAASWEKTMRLQQDADCLKRFIEMPRVILDDLEITADKEAVNRESLDEEER